MSSQESNSQNNESNHSQCPECKKKYVSSSEDSEQSQENQRIIIPLRKDLLNNQNNQTQLILKTLKEQIQNLKKQNNRKDKTIQDLRKQIEHKMTHYMMFGQINKQADEINRLKNQISLGTNVKFSRKKQLQQDQIRSIFRQQSKKFVQNVKPLYIQRNYVSPTQTRYKTYSTYDNYGDLKKELLSDKKSKQCRNKKKDPIKQKQQIRENQYYQGNDIQKNMFKISEAKKRIIQVEQKNLTLQKQILWMSNFISTFIKTMQQLAYKYHQQQILISEWSLKKKAKTSWRYMKHLFQFLYQESK